MGQNVSYVGILEFVEAEFQRLVRPECSRFLTHRDLTRIVFPTGCKLNLYHLPILYVIDSDHDGVFSLQDLQLFAAFVAEVSSKESELIQINYGQLIQSMCVLKMRHEHLGQQRSLQNQQQQQQEQQEHLRRRSLTESSASSSQLAPSPRSSSTSASSTVRHKAAEWVTVLLARMYPETALQQQQSQQQQQQQVQLQSQQQQPQDEVLPSPFSEEPVQAQQPQRRSRRCFGREALFFLYQLLSKGSEQLPCGGDFSSFFDAMTSANGFVPPSPQEDEEATATIEEDARERKQQRAAFMARAFIGETELTQFLATYFNAVFDSVDALGLTNMSIRPGG